MVKTLEEVEELRMRLVEKYLCGQVNEGRYISGIGIIKIKSVDRELIPKFGEYGIKFYVRETVKSLFEIPEEIEGVRIYKINSQDVLWSRKRREDF